MAAETYVGPKNAVGSTLAGKYRLDQELGRGGMGAVFLAENVVIGRKVAIKLLHPAVAQDPQMLARFRMEARAAGAIGHPGIVDVLDLGSTADGSEFIVMERLEGQTLAARLRDQGRLDPVEAVGLVAAVLDALAAAHAKDIVHRDLKPENIFVLARPGAGSPIKILDFGISKFRGDGDLGLTATGVVMGSPLYMSPEQARGARDVGPATDLWAVGVILYQLLAGRPPFEGESYNEVMAKVLTDPPPPLATVAPGVEPQLAAIVTSLLAKEPGARPQGAWELRAALLAAVDAGATRPEIAVPEGAAREARRRRGFLVAGGALAVVVLALAVALLRPSASSSSGRGPGEGAGPRTQAVPGGASSPSPSPAAGVAPAPAAVAPTPAAPATAPPGGPAAAAPTVPGSASPGTAPASAAAPGRTAPPHGVTPPGRKHKAASGTAAPSPPPGGLRPERKNPYEG